jgi:hypothetical protein
MFLRSTLRSKLFPTVGFRIIIELSSPEDLPDLKLTSCLLNGCTIARRPKKIKSPLFYASPAELLLALKAVSTGMPDLLPATI